MTIERPGEANMVAKLPDPIRTGVVTSWETESTTGVVFAMDRGQKTESGGEDELTFNV